MAFGVTCEIDFDAAHRLVGYDGKCAVVHGHSYVARVTCRCTKLDDCGMGIDFGILKGRVRAWISGNWDHNLILHVDDPILGEAKKQTIEAENHYLKRLYGRVPFVLPYNPTAENMAKYLHGISNVLLSGGYDDLLPPTPPGVVVDMVTIQETKACSATYFGD